MQLRPRQRAPSGICPAAGGDQAAGSGSCRILLGETKEAHRVGVASVQLTRSTFAEATAGRESLQPRALRARCTWKGSRSFHPSQERRERVSVANCDFLIRNTIPTRGHRMQACQHAKMHRAGLLPRPTSRPTSAEAIACRRAINLRRSVLGAPGTLGPRDVPRQAPRELKCALCEFFFTRRSDLRWTSCALERTGPWIRRAGCAFVHFPD